MTIRPGPVKGGPPKKLGEYEVGAKIGGGGMATVYIGRASKAGFEDEVVALKVIRDELAHDETFAHMFIDEAKILARLSHPNVIQTVEYGISGRHRFIAMELLAGRTYADLWDKLAHEKKSLPFQLGAWICARVADGLHSAHELVDDAGISLNVVHRDVNPTNIFLTFTGEVKLIDFGLAKARVRVSKSADGIVKGKIPYLAPEQAHGKSIDRRIDIYAIGTTLWEGATMKRLFKRDTDVDTLRAIREAHVPDARELVKDFPEELWKIIDKATQRDPAARYQTAADLAKDLDAYAGREKKNSALSDVLSDHFPGQEARHVSWARAATSVRTPAFTMPPPAPVPTASSSMIDPDKTPAPPDPPPPSSDPPAPKKKTKSSAPPPPETTLRRSSLPPAPYLEKETDPASARRLWISVAVVAAVIAGLIFAFTR